MKTLGKSLSAFFLLASLFAVACSSPIGPSPSSAFNAGRNAGLTIVLSLPGGIAASGMRTLVPVNMSGLVKSFSATLSGPGDTRLINADTSPLTVSNLAQGTWTIAVSAWNEPGASGQVIASGSGSVIVGSNAQYSTSVALDYNPLGTVGTGSVNITVGFPLAPGVDAVDAKFAGDSDFTTLPISNASTTPSVTLTRSGVTAGTPLLEMRFKKNDGVLCYYTDSVWVFPNATTTATKTISVSDFGSAPRAPVSLQAVARGSGRIDLYWSSPASTAASFTLRRSTSSGGSYSDVATLIPPTATSCSDTTVSTAFTQDYWYRLVAVNHSGESAPASTSVTYDNTVDAETAALTLNPAYTSDFVLSGTGSGGTVVYWSSTTPSTILVSSRISSGAQAGNYYATVFRPANPAPDASATLTATVYKGSAASSKSFSVAVTKADAGSAAEAVRAAKLNLLSGFAFASGDSISSVTQNITFPGNPPDTVLGSWETGDQTILSASGVPSRPSNGNYGILLDVSITSTADPTVSDTWHMVPLVLITDQGAVDNSGVGPSYAWGDSAASVTKNVGFPASGGYGTSATWSAGGSSFITNTGVVTRPSGADQNATLTATVTRNSASRTWSFPVTIKADLVAPTVDSTISIESVTSSTLNLFWGEAYDDVTPPQFLQYKVVRAGSTTAIDTVAEAEAATVVQTWTAGMTSLAVSGLSDSTLHAFAVLVKDAAGNEALYAPAAATTQSTITIIGGITNPPLETPTILDADNSNAVLSVFSIARGSSKALATDISGVAYTWSVDGETIGSAATFTLQANDYGIGGHNLVLEVQKVVNGPWYSGNAVFSILMTRTDAQRLAAARTALAIGYTGSDQAVSVAHDIVLPSSDSANGATIAWSSDQPLVLSCSTPGHGTVVRSPPILLDTTVNLSAVITVGNEVSTRQFLLKVLSDASVTARGN